MILNGSSDNLVQSMENLTFPKSVIIDIDDIVKEFISVWKPGGCPLDGNDFCFVEEVLTSVHRSFIDLNSFEYELNQTIALFADNTIHYHEGDFNPGILIAAVFQLAQSIVVKLQQRGAYINNMFPYVFRQFTNDYAVIFELAPEYIGDRYLDPIQFAEELKRRQRITPLWQNPHSQ